MKKSIFVIAAVVSLLFASCGNNSKKEETVTTDSVTAESTQEAEVPVAEASIVGVWKMTDFEVDMEVPKGQEAAMDAMKKKMVDATVYTFNEDGTMSYKNHLIRGDAGTYTYEDGKITIKSDKTKQSESVTVIELTSDKLVIVSEQGGRKAVMSFSKQNK